MGRIGVPELLVILAIIVVIFGANRLPGLGKGIGSAIRNFKDGLKDDGGRSQELTALSFHHPLSASRPSLFLPGRCRAGLHL